jgi:uncharacterized membrane protein
MAAVGYYLLQRAIIAHDGLTSALALALGRDIKGKLSMMLYATGILLAFVQPWISIALYVLVSVIWFVPDRRIEKAL